MKKLVRQHNDFVAAPYAVEFTSHEIKIIEYMIAESRNVDREFIEQKRHKEFTLSATELAKVLNTSLSRLVADADKLANNITNKKIIEKTIDVNGDIKEFSYIPIISLAKYDRGTFTFAFNFYVLKYFVDINKNFTEFQLNHLLSMTSTHAIKLYKLLYQYKNIGKRLFLIEELKEQFGLRGKYPAYGGFKNKVIVPAVNQINAKTDLNVQYSEIKLGRSVDKIEFCFEKKRYNQVITIDNNLSNPPSSSDDLSDDNLHNFNPPSTTSTLKACELNPVSIPKAINELIQSIADELTTSTLELLNHYYTENGHDYVAASINYTLRNATANLDKYLADTLKNGWAELELKKFGLRKKKNDEQLRRLQQEQVKKKLDKEHEQLAKSAIEHQWHKLRDSEKDKYIQVANFIVGKYSAKLAAFVDLQTKLPLSVYAVSNDKFYDRMLESYLKNIVNVSLNLNEYE